MKFAIMYEIQMPKPWYEGQEYDKYWQAMAQLEYAEEWGFDQVWMVEHHALEEFSHSSAPEVFFAAASQRTSTIRFGHGAILLPTPYNHPVRVAERVGALDILSNGRVNVGFARSTTLTEMGTFGIDPADTRPMMDEAIHVIPQLWMSERFPGYRGKYFTIGENRNVLPKPIQKPHPPLFMACSSPDSFRLAADYGVGVLMFTINSPQTLVDRIQTYRAAIQTPRDPVSSVVNNQINGFIMAHCGERNDEAIELGGEAMHWYMSLLRHQAPYWQRQHEQHRKEVFEQVESYNYAAVRAPEAYFFGTGTDERMAEEELAPPRLVEQGLLCAGNPDTCIKVLERYADLGVDTMMLYMEVGRIPHHKVMESIKMFGKYVLPHFIGRSDWYPKRTPEQTGAAAN